MKTSKRHPVYPRLLFLAVLLASPAAYPVGPDYQTYEEPVPNSALDIEGSFEAPKEPLETRPEEFRRRITNLHNFLWNDASLLLRPRSYYMDRQRQGAADSKAWAIGGALEYSTGTWRDRVRLGAAAYTSQKLHGPSDKDGTLLLKRRQQGFSVLGEAFLEARLWKTTKLGLYRQKLNMPYVNKQDSRMVPNTFETYFVRDLENPRFNYIAGHVTRMKRRSETSFIHMSEAAGAENSDKGLSMIGGLYTPSEYFNIGAINHHAWDVMNVFYTEANGKWALTDEFALQLSGQYTSQKSIGSDLIGDFDTHVLGTRASLSYRNAILTAAYTSTDNDQGILTPYGGYPGFISLIISDFNRAGEDAWLIGLSYNFSRFGLDGLSGFINYANSDTPDSGSRASPDQWEFDFTLDYVFDTPLLDGFWIRARAAHLDQDGPGAVDVDDYRIILNYSLPLR